MVVSYDPEAGATYLELRDDVSIAQTVSVSDLVMVDLDEQGEPVGVDFAVAPTSITTDMLNRLADAFPASLKQVAYDPSWRLTSA